MKAKRVYLRLNPERESDRRVLDYLENYGGSNGRAITVAVLDYLDRQEEKRQSKAFLQEVKDTILDCLQSFSVPSCERSIPAQSAEEDEEVSPLDFLSDMTGGCNFGL